MTGHRATHVAASLVLVTTLGVGCNSLFGIEEARLRPLCAETDPLEPLIDDMEDHDESICPLGGRRGFWYAADDHSGGHLTPGIPFEQTKIPNGERGTSQYAARFMGSGFTDWGAVMGFNLNQSEQTLGSQPYNASNSNGVKFWMKSKGPVQVTFRTLETVPLENGGECVNTNPKNNCNDDYAFQISAPSPGWAEYEVPFDALAQIAGHATWNPQHLLGIQFNVPPGSPFDVWVDDVRFYIRCSSTGCIPTCSDLAFPVACPSRGHSAAGCRPPGTDCAAASAGCADPLLIDDLEDVDSGICSTSGRSGRWEVHGDGSSLDLPVGGALVPTPIPGGRGASHYAAHLGGSGFLAWGANVGFDLLDVGSTESRPYDASQYGGITFWSKNDVPLSVGVSVPDTVPIDQQFGTCRDNGVNCYNDFVFEVRPSGGDWVERVIPFSALEQWALLHESGVSLVAGSARWDPAHLLGVVFSAHYSTFDVWVDDIRFYTCQTDCPLPTCSPEEPMPCPASGGVPAGCWPAGTDCSKPRERVRNTAVWGSGPNDIWIVGYSRTTLQGSLRHWTGSGWAPPTSDTVPPLWGVWGTSSDNVWAVADRGTVLHWNGSAWSSTAVAPATATFNGVGGGGASDVWAIQAPGTMIRRTDATWVPTPTGTADPIQGVWGFAPGDVWAVGDHGTLLHWNGSAWSASASGALPFTAVWGSRPGEVWAVGKAGAVAHLTGSLWSAVPSATAQNLRGVWGSGPDDVWAVGDVGTIVHWDGSAWSSVASGTTQRLLGVWGSGPDDVWAVGLEIILHWNGQAWSVQR